MTGMTTAQVYSALYQPPVPDLSTDLYEEDTQGYTPSVLLPPSPLTPPRRSILAKHAPFFNSPLRYEFVAGDTLDPHHPDVLRAIIHRPRQRSPVVEFKFDRTMPLFILKRKLRMRWQAAKDEEARKGLSWMDENVRPVFPAPAPAHSVFKSAGAASTSRPNEKENQPAKSTPGITQSSEQKRSPTRSIPLSSVRKPRGWSDRENCGIIQPPSPVASKARASKLGRAANVFRPVTNFVVDPTSNGSEGSIC